MRHSKEVKKLATDKVLEGKTALFDIAQEFQVSTNTLRTWLRESEALSRAQQSAKRAASGLTDERRTAVSQRQRLLMHAVDESPATIIVTDSEGKIVFANPKFSTTTGYRTEEAIGKTPRLLKSGETSPEDYRRLWKAIKAGKEWHGVFHNKRKDGSLYWERASISPVHDAKGKITHFMAVKEDITEFMEADAARRRSASGFVEALSVLPDAVVLVDKDGHILMANHAAEQLFGTKVAEGTPFAELNLLWVDENGMSLAYVDHPLVRALDGKTYDSNQAMKIGVAPPTGGMHWLRMDVRNVSRPESHDVAALLVLREDNAKRFE